MPRASANLRVTNIARNGFLLSAHSFSLSATMPPWFCRCMVCPKNRLFLFMTSASFVLPSLCRLISNPAFCMLRTNQVRAWSQWFLHRHCLNDVQYVISQYNNDRSFFYILLFLEYKNHFHHHHHHHDEAVGKSLKNPSIRMGKYRNHTHVHTLCSMYSWMNENGMSIGMWIIYSQVPKYLDIEVILVFYQSTLYFN